MTESKHLLAVTACPSGVAHTYMAAESLVAAAKELGYTMDAETHGSIGVENQFSDEAIERAEAVVIAADKQIDTSRFAGKRIVMARAADGIHKPEELINKALAAEPLPARSAGAVATATRSSNTGTVGQGIYNNLMNGVSHMIPFVVVGGLFLAIALSIYGQAGAPEAGLPKVIWDIGVLGFTLMVPILSGYIAYAIADRPGLAPGMICGLLATSPDIYNSEASAGFLGGLITGFAAGYVALAIKKIPVHRYIQPVMPIIIIPVLTTLIVGLAFVYVLGGPIAAIFTSLTGWLSGMTGVGVVTLGIILGLLTGFDLGGPVNKVAFVTTGALISAGQYVPGAMNGVAVAVPPIGLALAAFVARRFFTDAERQNGIAAAAMGFFGITEGAIPFAAARPLQIIPANMIGAAAGAATAGALMVENRIWWGGPIVAVLGGTSNALLFIFALLVGCVVTAAVAIGLIMLTEGRKGRQYDASAEAAMDAADGGHEAKAADDNLETLAADPTLIDLISPELIKLDIDATDRDTIIRDLAELGVATGQVKDVDVVVDSALAREAQMSTAVGKEVAIPHAKSAGAARPMLAFARTKAGVDWASPSGDLARMIFLISVPSEQAGDAHLKILANLSRALIKPEVRVALMEAKTPNDIIVTLNQEL